MPENSWSIALDPHSRVQYEVSWQPLLVDEDDVLVSHVFTLPSDAIAAGVEIIAQTETAYGGIVWLQVNASAQDDEIFDGEGTVFGLNSNLSVESGNVHDRTLNLRVKQR